MTLVDTTRPTLADELATLLARPSADALLDVTLFVAPPEGRFDESVLELVPDDGRRFELLDGTLVVTPVPTFNHQVAVLTLYRALHEVAPRELYVMLAPYKVRFSEWTVVEPDLLVAPHADYGQHHLATAPLLAVEVLSRSTRLVDLRVKKAEFEQRGVRAYWVIDPKAESLTAWEWRDGRYEQVAHVTGDEPFRATWPFPVELSPAALLADAKRD